MSFGNYVNLAEVEVTEYSNLGEGQFPMVITSNEEKKNDTGTRIYYMVSMNVFEGQFKDATHNEFFDVVNSENSTTEKIGRENIKKLATACGRPNATSFDELANIPFVSIRKKSKKSDYINTVAYEAYTPGAAIQQQPVAAQPAQQPAGGTPSWASQ